MTEFPPPSPLPSPTPLPLPVTGLTVEHDQPNFWRRRGRRGKVGIVGGGVLVGLIVLGAVIPTEADNDVDAASLAARTITVAPESGSSGVVETPPLSAVPVTVLPVADPTPTTPPPAASVPPTTSTPTTTTATTAPPPATAPSTTAPTTTAPPPATAPQQVVGRVIDGDTIVMGDGSTIRLIGIDTPERGACGYDEAADTLGLILYGHSVTLVPGARDDVDRYGRLLRYIDLDDGTDVNLAMILSGQAIARYDSRDGYGRHSREDIYVATDATSPAFCPVPGTTRAPALAPVVAAPPVPQRPTNVSYANCDAVRAAGAAPIRPGDPGFQAKFDRDNDGIGCE